MTRWATAWGPSARAFVQACTVAATAFIPIAQSRVVHFDVESTIPATPVTGAVDYVIVSGTFAGELDPNDSRNRIITDLRFAPRNERGSVEYRATFRLARPADPAKASGLLYHEVPNRGRGSVAADPDGHIRVISGWQADLTPGPGVQSITVPVARWPNGRSITGPVLARFTKVSAGDSSIPIVAGHGDPVPRPPPVSLDTRKARLLREHRDGTTEAVPADDWVFAACDGKPFPGTPDPGQLCLKDGFDPDVAYTLVYTARDPLVLGIGFAATRDLVSFLRSGLPDSTGQPNPAGRDIRWAVASGTSQSGNYLRSFVHLGFNADENDARVFDGINPNIAVRQLPLNVRFGLPGGAAGVYEAGSEGTLWWGRHADKARGRKRSSLLDRCTRHDTCPKVIETLGSAEFWGLRASPGFVGLDVRTDLPLPDNVRRYYFPGVTHGGAQVIGFPATGSPDVSTCLLPGNPNPSTPNLRAAQRALIDWVRDGKEPPASRYPTLASGELVAPTAAAMGWPAISGMPSPDGKLNAWVRQDFGSGFRDDDLSGVMSRLPPRLYGSLPSVVPRVDSDGNETAGVRSVALDVPTGTYLGWNVETEGIEQGRGCGFSGGFIPFARTKDERIRNADPRPSLEERYGDHDGFVARLKEAVERQTAEGWLLPEDADGLLRAAEASDVLR